MIDPLLWKFCELSFPQPFSKVPATFCTVHDTMGASGQATCSGRKGAPVEQGGAPPGIDWLFTVTN